MKRSTADYNGFISIYTKPTEILTVCIGTFQSRIALGLMGGFTP